MIQHSPELYSETNFPKVILTFLRIKARSVMSIFYFSYLQEYYSSTALNYILRKPKSP